MIIFNDINLFNGGAMLDVKTKSLLAVAECRNFTRAAEALSLTQPAVSHHINQLEEELGVRLFVRGRGSVLLTREGEIVVNYAKRMRALHGKMKQEIADTERSVTKLRIGITHTSESNLTAEVLAKCSNQNPGLSITILTDSIKNLYDKIANYELDFAIVEGKPMDSALNSLMLATDYLVCVMSNNNPLSRRSMITLKELKEERMILRLPASATRALFESTLESINETIDNFNVIIEVDNIETIKNLIRKDMGVSILAKSACMDELRKGKIVALPIENLSMIRETNLVYNKDFIHMEVLQEITRLYQETLRKYQ